MPPTTFAVGNFRQVLNKAAQDVLVAGATPEAALKAAEERFNTANRVK